MNPLAKDITTETAGTKKTTFTKLAIATIIAIAIATTSLVLYLSREQRKNASNNDNEEINSYDYNYINAILNHSNCPQAHNTAISAINSRGMITQRELKKIQEQLEECKKNAAKEELRQNIGRQHSGKSNKNNF